MSKALLQDAQLPAFNTFSVDDFPSSVRALVAEYRQQISKITSQSTHTWENSIAPLSDIQRRLDHVWSLISHSKAVNDTERTREVYKILSDELTEFRSEKSQNQALFEVYKSVYSGVERLNPAQTKVLDDALLAFRLNGVDLREDAKEEFKALNQELVRLTNKFAENVLDATECWSLYISNVEDLRGTPEATLARLSTRANDEGYETGYLLGLDITLYLPVMQNCENRVLRERLYKAFITRASKNGEHDTKLANESLMSDIMVARARKAALLQLKSYADMSLQTKMAESPEQVIEFLDNLYQKAKPLALKELDSLSEFASDKLGIEQLELWDYPFVSESYRKANFDINQEQLRQYFQLPRVLESLFDLVGSLFGISLELDEQLEIPHKDTLSYRVLRDDKPIAYIFMDLFAREGKRSGAWVATCHKRAIEQKGCVKLPVAFLVCNFSAPHDGKPSLLTHNELVTLFHEFGHALHHCLTKVDYPEVSGISGVPWDAVELPSQFLENWCWEPAVLKSLSLHVDTGETLSDDLIDRLVNTQNYLAGMMTLRQLEFATFDFRLHHEFEIDMDIQALLEEVQAEISILPVPSFARFANAFSHIFAGGYAAGYYSYKWAEVLAADAFSAFKEEGVMNTQTGQRFLHEILEVGGTADVNEMFKAFRGRMPSSEALLKQMGA